MKSFLKRAVSLLLTVAMLTGLLAAVALTAEAYSYNNGRKGVLCTSLSSSAKAYYTSGYDYATLSKLSGTTLEAKLRERMVNGWHGGSYDSLKSSFKYTDAYNGSSSSVYCFYSNTSVTSWNREHVWPQSKGTFAAESNSAGSDVIHLRPTDNTANSTRSNRPYGEVTGGTYHTVYTSNGKVAGYYSSAYYEPLDSVKGDVARTLLYVYTRWEERNLKDVIYSTDMLLKWCEEDPVDEFEMKRNDICQEICGSRNIFVDYPEYCWRVFGRAIPTHMKTPSGSGNTCSTPDYTYTVTKAATCTVNGTGTYTCKYCGYSYTEVIPAEGHNYVNGTCTKCGKQQAAVQYFATDKLSSGDEVVIYNPSGKKIITTTASVYQTKSQLKSASATLAGTELSFTAADAAIFTVEVKNGNYAFKLPDGRYLTCEVAENLTMTASPKSGTNYWSLQKSTTDGCYYVKNTVTTYQDYQSNPEYLEYYANVFTTYGLKGDDAFKMQFFKATHNEVCTHDYQISATKAATCTEKGYTRYQCSKCGDAYTNYTNALGHQYDNVETKPTCTEGGYTTHTCARCGDVYTDNLTEPKGHCFVDGVCARCGETEAVSDPCEGYKDIDRNAWYHASVDFVIKEGLMGSTKSGDLTFEPNVKVSRAMVASILYRIAAEGESVPYQGTFRDVKEGQWFTTAIEWCAANGLCSGKGDGKFDPNGNVTRQELAIFMYNLAKFLGRDVSGRADLNSFADAASVPAWSKDYLAWAVSEGIISGQASGGKTYLKPTAGAMRSELASILMRFMSE